MHTAFSMEGAEQDIQYRGYLYYTVGQKQKDLFIVI